MCVREKGRKLCECERGEVIGFIETPREESFQFGRMKEREREREWESERERETPSRKKKKIF